MLKCWQWLTEKQPQKNESEVLQMDNREQVLYKAVKDQAEEGVEWVIVSGDYDSLRWYAERLRAMGYTVTVGFMQVVFIK